VYLGISEVDVAQGEAVGVASNCSMSIAELRRSRSSHLGWLGAFFDLLREGVRRN
jgi:hypothetical protein